MCGLLFRSCSPGLFLLFLMAGPVAFRHELFVSAAEDSTRPNPDAVCASCHGEITTNYGETPMAHASGPAADGLIPADFRHQSSGVHYTVSQQENRVWMSYERDDPARPLKGRQELRYFIGSGKRGRTYLFEQEGYWFEAPINWYARKQIWDMTPNHLADREMPLTLPVDPGCLHCHASRIASSMPDARNHYAGAPFTYGGITCEACHGDASSHVASQGKVHMLAINALDTVRRDSVCLNCHLEGQAAVGREGRRPEDFAPGDDLFDYTRFFVYRGEASGQRATSQWEALLKSACKKRSGDRMTCTTCHDPHRSPAPGDRVTYYRQRCLQCHNQARFATRHHPENSDCTACHMSRAASTDIAHEQVTDHLIRARLSNLPAAPPASGELEAVGEPDSSDRDLGLAYAQMSLRGDHEADSRAVTLLRQEEKLAHGAPDDAELHTQLGFLDQVNGDLAGADDEYGRALKANPYDSLALGDLALIKAKHHQYAEAERLWRSAFDHDPVETGAGMNLAIVACQTGNRSEAVSTLDRLLLFDPDNTHARALLAEIRSGTKPCTMPR